MTSTPCERLDVDVVRTLLHAKTATVADLVVLDDMKKLELRFCAEDFEEISDKAECSKKNSPRDVCSKYIGNIIHSEEHADPQPELKRI